MQSMPNARPPAAKFDWCAFEPLDDDTVICRRCGIEMAAEGHESAKRPCKPKGSYLPWEEKTPCVYRSRQPLSMLDNCSKVYNCALFGECTVGANPGRMDCSACSSRKTLFRLEFYHGLGDAAQFTAICRHLRHYYPGSRIELVVHDGQERLFDAVADECGQGDMSRPPTHRIRWWEPRASYAGMPSTKVEKCLLEEFDLQPIPELSGYLIEPPEDAKQRAAAYLASLDRKQPKLAALHYQGASSEDRKNLTDGQAADICRALAANGYDVLLIDDRARSPIPGSGLAQRLPAREPLFPAGNRAADASCLAALIAQVDLVVGIDSGPLHVATSVGTKAIGIWTRMSPLHYFCPDKTTTHLIPRGHGPDWERHFIWKPIDQGAAFLRENYRLLKYDDPAAMLGEFLKSEAACIPA